MLIKITLVPMLLGTQSCSKQEVKPVSTVGENGYSSSKVIQQMQSTIANGKTVNNEYEKRVEKILRVKASSAKNKQDVVLLKIREETCYDVYQTYIDVNSGEIVGRRYLGEECYSNGDGGEDGPSTGPTGGGGSTGGTGSSGNSEAHDLPTDVYNATATVSQQQPTTSNANYAATLLVKPTPYHVINVQVEVDRQAKELKKVTVTLNGITWLVKYTQVSDGTLLRYDPATDTYYFKVTTLKELGGVYSSHREIQGTISPSQGHGTLSIF